MRFVFGLLLVAVLYATAGAAQASAQSCPALQATAGPTPTACVAAACSVITKCYTASRCSFTWDWPKGVATGCEICNQAYLVSTGLCLVQPYYVSLYNAPIAGCTPTCSFPGVTCGSPDGCGGTCQSDALCGLFVRRPELLVPITMSLQ